MCYQNDILKDEAPAYCKEHGLNLSERDLQHVMMMDILGEIRIEPYMINMLIIYYKEHKIPGSDYIISKALKIQTENKEEMKNTIIRVLNNRVPVWIAVRGRYKHVEIDGVWHTVYTKPKSYGGGHAIMLDRYDGEFFYAENSGATPRAKIEDIGCIYKCFAFEFKQIT